MKKLNHNQKITSISFLYFFTGRSDETLLQAHFSLLIPKLRLDAEDWNNEIRIQSAQLLYQFLMGIGSGNHEIIHVMEILFHQFGDEEARIRNWVNNSCNILFLL